nr:immunoglobulin heavy chain junction region [Mus musculus]
CARWGPYYFDYW